MEDIRTSLTTEILEYRCAGCEGNNWRLRIGKRSDGEVYLLISCNNPQCIEEKKEEYGDDNHLILWDEFRITDQVDHHEVVDTEDKIYN